MIFVINNALVATGKKVAPITSAGDFAHILSAFCKHMFAFHLHFPQISRHSNAMPIAPSREVGLHTVPG